MSARLMVALGLAGCAGRHPLEEAPVEGGTAPQRAAIEEELARFERWIGAGRVELPGVEVRPATGRYAGAYDPMTARIVLSEELEPGEVPEVLRHELCHALDMQEGLLDRAVPAFEAIADRATRDEGHPLHDSMDDGRRTRRAQVFAYVCQQAPLGTALLARPCPGDSTEYAEAAAFVADEVWTGAPDVSLDALGALSPAASWQAPFALDGLRAVGSASLDVVWLAASGDGTSMQAAVSALDAAEAEFFEDLATEAIEAGYDAPAPFRAPDLDFFSLSTSAPIDAVSDGAQTARIIRGLRLDELEVRPAPQLLAGPLEGPWSVVEGACVGDASSVFVANGRRYAIWAQGAETSWGGL